MTRRPSTAPLPGAADSTETVEDPSLAQLRARVEAALPPRPVGEREAMLHELSVHQAELEVQNEELRAAQVALEVSSRRWADLFDHAPVPYLIVGRDAVVRDVNTAAAALFGPKDTLRRHSFLRLAAEGEALAVRQLLDDAWQGGGISEVEVRLQAHAGWAIPVEVTASVCEGPQGWELLLVVRDLTERHRAEAERQRLAGQVDRLQRLDALGRMAGAVAHELKNVLTVVLTTAEAGVQEWPAEMQREYFEEIAGAANRGRDLTTRLLGFSRVAPARIETTGPGELVEEAGALLRRLSRGVVEVRLEVALGVPAVRADPAAVVQALLNLGMNSLDAMGERGGRLTLRAAAVDLSEADLQDHPGLRPGRYVQLAAADTGPGFTPEALDNAFEPFFTTKPAGKGTGLGLAMVFGVARDHGGFATVARELVGGALVTLHLPAVDAAGAARGAAAGTSPARALAMRTQRIGQALVVDDEPAAARAMQRMLRRVFGIESTLARSGPEALQRLREPDAGDIGLVLLDLRMPGMGGIETLRGLRQIKPELPVVLMTGDARDHVPAEVLTARHTGFIAKPPGTAELESTLDRLLRRDEA
jgi:two-component system cell cycle sensor histidine kinase/response regulator CckA